MSAHMMPSDPEFAQMDALAMMLAVLKNPIMHLRGYAVSNNPVGQAINRAFADDELARAVAAVAQAQQELMDALLPSPRPVPVPVDNTDYPQPAARRRGF
jgi:hypothetical protein